MTLNGYFMSNMVFVAAVLLRTFDFHSVPQKMNEDRRTQSEAKANEFSKSAKLVRIFAPVP